MPEPSSTDLPSAVLISGSPSAASRSRALLERVAAALAARGTAVTMIDLAALPPAALLGRGSDPSVSAAIDAVGRAWLVVVATPLYRATYTGLLKVFFDLLRPDTLRNAVALIIATGASPEHALAIPHTIAPMVGTVGALVAPGVFATDAEFEDRRPGAALEARLAQAVARAYALAQSLHTSVS